MTSLSKDFQMTHHHGGGNMESILETIKEKLGLNPDYTTSFDESIIISINSAFIRLRTLGIGTEFDTPFHITGNSEKWNDFFGENPSLDMVKDYIYLKTKMTFDPPSTSFTIEAYNKQLEEMEFIFTVLLTDKKKEDK